MANPFAQKKLEGVFSPPPRSAASPQPTATPEAPVEMEEPEEESELLEQAQVLYSNGNTCSGCGYFQGDGADCSKVKGPIQGNGWCILYKPGAEEAPEEALEMEALPDEG